MEQGDFRQGPGEEAEGPGKVDRAIALAAPLLDLVLAVGERVSRIAEPVDYEYYPVRRPEESSESEEDRAARSRERPDGDRR